MQALFARLEREAAVIRREQEDHCITLELNNGAKISLLNKHSSAASPPEIWICLYEGEQRIDLLRMYPLPNRFNRCPSETRFVIDINDLPSTLPDISPVPQLFALALETLKEILVKETIRRTRLGKAEGGEG